MKEVKERLMGFRTEMFCIQCNEFTIHYNLDCCQCDLSIMNSSKIPVAKFFDGKDEMTLSTIERAVERLFE